MHEHTKCGCSLVILFSFLIVKLCSLQCRRGTYVCNIISDNCQSLFVCLFVFTNTLLSACVVVTAIFTSYANLYCALRFIVTTCFSLLTFIECYVYLVKCNFIGGLRNLLFCLGCSNNIIVLL